MAVPACLSPNVVLFKVLLFIRSLERDSRNPTSPKDFSFRTEKEEARVNACRTSIAPRMRPALRTAPRVAGRMPPVYRDSEENASQSEGLMCSDGNLRNRE